MTYLERILDYLTDEPQSLDSKFFNNTKTTHAVEAVKKGIDQGIIIMIPQPGVKTKYEGHLYYLNPLRFLSADFKYVCY